VGRGYQAAAHSFAAQPFMPSVWVCREAGGGANSKSVQCTRLVCSQCYAKLGRAGIRSLLRHPTGRRGWRGQGCEGCAADEGLAARTGIADKVSGASPQQEEGGIAGSTHNIAEIIVCILRRRS